MTTTEKEQTSWETETGLPNDIDGYIANSKFGMKDEYAQAIAATGAQGAGLMFLFDIVDAKGDLLGSQGFSVGTGWIASEDGQSISHPKRKNVVNSSMYGQLQNRVVKVLKVDMESRGLPTEAKPWNRLGFHWMQEPHKTVGGEEATAIMPTIFIGELGAEVTPAAPAAAGAPAAPAAEAAVEVPKVLDARLTLLAKGNNLADFQEKALALEDVAANDALMASILEEGPEGYWATHQEK